jgi:hypothetical protein
VATSSSPDGSAGVAPLHCYQFSSTYNVVFWKLFTELGLSRPPSSSLQWENVTFVFELQSPENTVVIHSKDRRLHLHGARSIATLEELDPVAVATQLGWPCVRPVEKVWQSIDELWDHTQTLPLNNEGCVESCVRCSAAPTAWTLVGCRLSSQCTRLLVPRARLSCQAIRFVLSRTACLSCQAKGKTHCCDR